MGMRPPKSMVTAKAITPCNLHFEENHGGIPQIGKERYSFDVDGKVANPRKFKLNDLMDAKMLLRAHKLAMMQCSGVRRTEQIGLYQWQGDEDRQTPYVEGAIGKAH